LLDHCCCNGDGCFRVEQKDAGQHVGFVPAVVVPESSDTAVPAPAGVGAIEIEFATGSRMRITGVVDKATLTAAVAALTDGRRR
jgi:transposase